MFGMNRYLDFQYDMNMKSMIQEGLCGTPKSTSAVNEIVKKFWPLSTINRRRR